MINNKKEKMRKKEFMVMVLSFIVLILIINFSLAEGEVNYCCEKTNSGAWCQNAPLAECDSNFLTTPTSCEATSYCKPGCCYDPHEGLCMESTSQRICQANNGIWADNAQCNIPQCNLGCCVLENQGALVTLTRCKTLSGYYGLLTDFRTSIQDEVTCVATAQGQDMGACVYETNDGERSCSFKSRVSCQTASLSSNATITNTSNGTLASLGFYKDILCTNPALGVNCGKTTKTIILEGQDEVYYLDTCNNLANIYDSSKYNDNEYWRRVFKKSESCGAGSSNANSKTCGNCDYYYGSIGKRASGLNGPVHGNYICVDLSCSDVDKQHGESWCKTDSPTGNGLDSVGSSYYRELCVNNEIITEPCADFRNEICLEGEINGFTEAACRVNRWQDCLQQEEQIDCENTNQRDCLWKSGYYYSTSTSQITMSNNDSSRGAITPEGICMPNYPPGLQFWGNSQPSGAGLATTSNSQATSSSVANTGNSSTPAFTATTPAFGTGYVPATTGGTSASAQCSVGNAKLTIKWTKVKRLWPDNDEAWKCDQDFGNCQYVEDSITEISDEQAANWAASMNEFCYNLGDCGGYINWQGAYTEDGFAAYKENERVAGSGGASVLEVTSDASVTGNMISNQIKNMVMRKG